MSRSTNRELTTVTPPTVPLTVPTAFHPNLTDPAGVERRPSMQGQDVAPIIDLDSAPGTPLCQLAILMDPGKVSTPHIHYSAWIIVYLQRASGRGVLTLFGEDLDQEVWLRTGGSLVIPPGVVHVAVNPRNADPADNPIAVAIETRSVDDWRVDVVARNDKWHTLYSELLRRDVRGDVDFPMDRLTMTSDELLGISTDGSCFPSNPDPGAR